jgi:hypothetical protein
MAREWDHRSTLRIADFRLQMKILSNHSGAAAGMYCGSCLRDNALAARLLKEGHEVTLVPIYTPL